MVRNSEDRITRKVASSGMSKGLYVVIIQGCFTCS